MTLSLFKIEDLILDPFSRNLFSHHLLNIYVIAVSKNVYFILLG